MTTAGPENWNVKEAFSGQATTRKKYRGVRFGSANENWFSCSCTNGEVVQPTVPVLSARVTVKLFRLINHYHCFVLSQSCQIA